MAKYKQCLKCGRRPISAFGKNRARPDGLNAYCRSCTNAAKRARYKRDPEKYRAASRSYANRHPEVRRAAVKRFYWRHREQVLRTCRIRRASRTLEQIERVKQRMSAYDKTHRDEHAARQAKRRANKRAGFVEHVDRRVVHARDRGKCYLCGKSIALRQMHLEHVVPLSRGGVHSYENCRASHPRCNLIKGSKMIEELTQCQR